MRSHFGGVVQNFELKRVGGAPKDYQFAPLMDMIAGIRFDDLIHLLFHNAHTFLLITIDKMLLS